MCGIAGYYGTQPPDQAHIQRTLARMTRRGPDDQSCKTFTYGPNTAVLLHARLSIIDLGEQSNQPFEIGPCALSFNGEIYNYLELRERLVQQGIHCATQGDTEVLLQMFLAYGDACFDLLEGMWAFALFDQRDGTLLLSRDRFAEKPLYVMSTPDGVYFASEIKMIQALSGRRLSVNYRQVKRYLVNGYRMLYKYGETFFEEISEVPFASYTRITPDLQAHTTRYWQPTYAPNPALTTAEAVEGVRERLIQSMKLRLRSDVPLAFCLSGGVDSTLLASIAAKQFNYDVSTFSIIDSDERYNEYPHIKATLDDLGCKHTLIELSYADTFARMERLVQYHDMPISTVSYYVHAFLTEAMGQAGFRVSISGTAADELFTGYYDHFNMYLYEMRHDPRYPDILNEWQTGVGGVIRNPYLRRPDLFFDQPTFRGHITQDQDVFNSYLVQGFEEAFREECFTEASLLRNRMLNELFHEVIPVILHEDDLNAMYSSIENRSPYLDRHLFEFANTIPTAHLIQQGYGKYILREAASGILNDFVRLNRQKKGFNASMNTLIDLSDPHSQEYLLADSPIFEVVRRDAIAAFIQQPGTLSDSFNKFLFSFLSAKLFLENWA